MSQLMKTRNRYIHLKWIKIFYAMWIFMWGFVNTLQDDNVLEGSK